ncbi:TetR/AcrR family transcriptional regulator [Actinomadura sp. GC306]|uniref:TetR/AcrR family transcriptional regulator n=1 Tax=Actinomadura sp. GC306 TaxID=2530367 RepID=UPI0010465E08|nr:TetR/AcrR family transcriptional regulator [Actinomadura sp. GC306]TDC67747.1 TetR/AcrR family transcriptional regulator [Actinomadura sp. GC306]
MSAQRPYAALLAKGEDRRQRILAVAQRLLTRHGSRGTTLGRIAREAGVTPAGLLHHFESKEKLLHAVLDARDSYDAENTDAFGDVVTELRKYAERLQHNPELIGMYVVLLAESLAPGAPLHDRFLDRYRFSLHVVAGSIRRGQRDGRYRTDLDPAVKAVEIMAFLNGIETSWLLDPSIPLAEACREYTDSLARRLAAPSGAR